MNDILIYQLIVGMFAGIAVIFMVMFIIISRQYSKLYRMSRAVLKGAEEQGSMIDSIFEDMDIIFKKLEIKK